MAFLSALLSAAQQTPEFRRAKRLLRNDLRLIRELVERRKERGLRQEDLAEAMGVSQQAISKLERYDGDPRLSSIRRYANAVGLVIEHTVIPDDGTAYSAQAAVSNRSMLHFSGVFVKPAEVDFVVDLGKSTAANAKRTDFALGA